MSSDAPLELQLKQGIDVAMNLHHHYLFLARDTDQRAFAEFMRHTAVVLGGVQKHVLPEIAALIVEELVAQLKEADEAMTRYHGQCRKMAKSLIQMRTERKKLASSMHAVEQHLPLLSICVAPPHDRDAAMLDLQNRIVSLQGDSAEAALQLQRVKAVADNLRLRTANSMHLHCADGRGVQRKLVEIRNKSKELHDADVEKVLEGCVAMHRALGVVAADGLHETSRQVLKMMVTLEGVQEAQQASRDNRTREIEKHDIAIACMLRLEEYMEQYISRSDMRSDRVDRVLNVLQDSDSLHGGTGGTGPITRGAMTRAMQRAICTGRLHISACLVLGVPLMRQGPLRPVTLPCCSLAVSRAGAEECFRRPDPTCRLCNSSLSQYSVDELPPHRAMELAVTAEERGVLPCLLSTTDFMRGPEDESGSEPNSCTGRLDGKHVTIQGVWLSVETSTEKDIAEVQQVAAASYLAGLASPHVRRLEGYHWTGPGLCPEGHLWLIKELCHGTLEHLVKYAAEDTGLPPADVASLGIMLCCALHGVHRGAGSLHLNVNPATVLVKLPSDQPMAASRWAMAADLVRGAVVKLTGVGLSHLCPSSRESHTWTDSNSQQLRIAQGPPGYVAPEQMHGRACHGSDVFSMGATLLYAATGKHPYNGAYRGCGVQACQEEVKTVFQRGIHMEVPDTIQPPSLRDLIVQLTLPGVSQRPTVTQAESVLRAVYADLTSRGQLPAFFARPAEPHAPGQRLQHSGSVTATCAGAPLTVPQDSTMSCEPQPRPRLPASHMPAAAGGLGGSPITTRAHARIEPGHASTSSRTHSAEELARSYEGLPREGPGSRDASGRSERSVGMNGIFNVGYLCEYLSRDHHDEVSSLGHDVLFLTSTWPAGDGPSMLRPLLATGGARQWMPEASLSCITNVASISGVHATVAYGTLNLGSAGCILVTESSHLILCDMTIEGGLVLCHGSESYLMLSNVQLQDCRLIVSDGAEVVLDDVDVQYGGFSPALVVSGHDTNVQATTVTISADKGVLVERGASFTGERMRVKEARVQGVSARDEGTVLTLSKSHINCTDTRARTIDRTAVIAARGAYAIMRECTLRDFYEGVSIASNAAVTLTGCTLDMSRAGDGGAGVSVCVGRVEWENTAVVNARDAWIRLVSVHPQIQERLALKVKLASTMTADTRTVNDSVMCTVDGEIIV